MEERIEEKSGIEALGFNPQSVAGLILPILFVILVGGIPAVLIWLSSR